MNVLVTGAGGFLGGEVVSRLLERGHRVRAMIRPSAPQPDWPDSVEILRADLRVSPDLEQALKGIECLVHLASATSGNEDIQFASTVVGTERLISALAISNVTRIILVSSLVVYDWAQAYKCMNEGTPLLIRPYEMGGYTIAKVWQERLFQRAAKDRDWDLRILRPGFIWGSQHTKIAAMGRSVGPLHFVFAPTARLPLTHVYNCADCIAAVAESSKAMNETFNVTDSDRVRAWRYAREHLKWMGAKKLLIPIPYHLGLLLGHFASFVSRLLFGKDGKLPSLLTPRRYEAQFKPIRYSSEKLRRVVNWNAPLEFEACLEKSYRTGLKELS